MLPYKYQTSIKYYHYIVSFSAFCIQQTKRQEQIKITELWIVLDYAGSLTLSKHQRIYLFITVCVFIHSFFLSFIYLFIYLYLSISQSVNGGEGPTIQTADLQLFVCFLLATSCFSSMRKRITDKNKKTWLNVSSSLHRTHGPITNIIYLFSG